MGKLDLETHACFNAKIWIWKCHTVESEIENFHLISKITDDDNVVEETALTKYMRKSEPENQFENYTHVKSMSESKSGNEFKRHRIW